ncbi:MAG: hydroxyacid dehydrogenase [Pseudomonadota bacterium]
MAEILITEFMDDAAVARLSADHEVIYDPALVDDLDRARHLAGKCRALIVRNRTEVRGALLDAAVDLECVGRLGVGLDNIDGRECERRNIAVYPATGANDQSVAEYVVTTVMMLLRGAYGASAQVAAGSWPRQRLIGREVSGKTLGLVGFGAIARQVAVRARALGMTVIAFDPFVPAGDPAWADADQVTLEELLARADAVSMHVPLTGETRDMIGHLELAMMRKGSVLVNAARGGVVDEVALAEALTAGHLGGAALDTFLREPVSAEDGALFKDVPNLILTPHIAGVTEESNVRVSAMIADLVAQHLAGGPTSWT